MNAAAIMHQRRHLYVILQRLEYRFGSTTSKCVNSFAGCTASAHLERKQIGVKAIASQTLQWPSCRLTTAPIQNDLRSGHIQLATPQSRAVVIDIHHMECIQIVVVQFEFVASVSCGTNTATHLRNIARLRLAYIHKTRVD